MNIIILSASLSRVNLLSSCDNLVLRMMSHVETILDYESVLFSILYYKLIYN